MRITPCYCTRSSRLRFRYFPPARRIIIFIYFSDFPPGGSFTTRTDRVCPGRTTSPVRPSVRSGPIIGRDHGKPARTGTHGVARVLRTFVNETRRTIVRAPRLIKPGTIRILIRPITPAVISIMRRIRRCATYRRPLDVRARTRCRVRTSPMRAHYTRIRRACNVKSNAHTRCDGFKRRRIVSVQPNGRTVGPL